MKILILLFMSFFYLYAINPIMHPIVGVNVEHTYTNGKNKNYTIQREVDPKCLNVGISVENFQSGDIASKSVPDECKKTFIVSKGVIQPLIIQAGIKTFAELEVLDFIATKSSKESSKYILVDSRTTDWFNEGTIPSAVNIPYDELEFDEDFEKEYKRAYKILGVKLLEDNQYDFSEAKTALFFCNGSWCAQSIRAIKHLSKIGYPKEKMIWYRGGIASWAGVSLTLTKKLEN